MLEKQSVCLWFILRVAIAFEYFVLIDFFDVESSNLVMASASSTSAKNLFQDSKRRLAERVQVNINNVGSVTRQVQRGSRSHDMLAQTARNFCQTETTMENTFNNLQKMQVLMAQLNQQENSIDNNLRHLPDIREQIRDMQRYFLKWPFITNLML